MFAYIWAGVVNDDWTADRFALLRKMSDPVNPAQGPRTDR